MIADQFLITISPRLLSLKTNIHNIYKILIHWNTSYFFQKDGGSHDCGNYIIDIKYVSVIVNSTMDCFVECFLVEFYNNYL